MNTLQLLKAYYSLVVCIIVPVIGYCFCALFVLSVIMNISVQKAIVINFILKYRIFFGYYNNVSRCGYKSFLFRVISVLIGAATLYVGIKCPVLEYGDRIVALKAFQYLAYAICALITGNGYLIKFFNGDLNSKKIYRKIYKFIIQCIVFLHVYYTVLGLSYYFSGRRPCGGSWINFSAVIYLNFAVDLGFIPVILILILFYLRTSFLCTKIRNEAIHLTTVFDWKKYVNIYIKHVETLEETDWPMKFMMAVNLIITFINISNTQLDLVRLYKSNELSLLSFYYMIMYVLHITYEYIKAFCPAIIMEFTLNEMDTLKIEMADKMITCTDARRKEQLHKMLTRFHSRPLSYTIWRAVRVDSSLPLGFLSLAATCLVCLLQFTHVLSK